MARRRPQDLNGSLNALANMEAIFMFRAPDVTPKRDGSVVYSGIRKKKGYLLLPKTKMEPENGPLEKRCVFLKTVIFLVSC